MRRKHKRKASTFTAIKFLFSNICSFLNFAPNPHKQLNMKYKITLALFFVCQLNFAQNTTLFEVSKPGNAQKSYLLGTIHAKTNEVFNFNDSLYHYLLKTDQALFELDLSSDQLGGSAMKSKMLSMFQGMDESTLKEFFMDDFLPKFKKKVKPQFLGQRINNDLLPALEEVLGKYLNFENARGMFMDLYIQKYADSHGIKTGGIETIDEQLDAIVGETPKIEKYLNKKMVKKVIRYVKKGDIAGDIAKLEKGTDDVKNSYVNLRIEEIDPAMQKSMSPAMYKRLITDRNNVMFERTKDLVANGSVFIAVGVGHIVGSGGLIALYKNAGYQIREVNISTPYRVEQPWSLADNGMFKAEMPSSMIKTLVEKTNEDTGDKSFTASYFNTEGMFTFTIDNYSFVVDSAAYDYSIGDEESYEEDSLSAIYEIDSAMADIDQVIIDEETADESLEIEMDTELDESADDEGNYEEEETEEVVEEEPYTEEPIYSDDDSPKTYFSELLDEIDLKSLGARFMDKMNFATYMNMTPEEEEININGKTSIIKIQNIAGQKVVTTEVINAEGLPYTISLTGDKKAFEGLDWKRILSTFELK